MTTIILLVAAFAIVVAVSILWRQATVSRVAAEQFRDKVLRVMKTTFPAKTFEAVPADSLVILVDGYELGLDNLRRKFDLSDKSEQTMQELVREHVTVVLHGSKTAPRFPESFDQARDRILPQIMAPSIAADKEQVRLPFAGDLFIGLVVDDEQAYMYLTEDALKKWGKTENEVYEIALRNLDSRSKGMEIKTFTNAGTMFMAVGVADGYDAARILLPGLKKMAAQRLGGPFCFGIPNREFLICWPQAASATVQEMAATRIAADFKTQPYPLSPSVFCVSENGTVTTAQQGGGHVR
jgi:uncharacterized protein YtpQ (UPF0354 family)